MNYTVWENKPSDICKQIMLENFSELFLIKTDNISTVLQSEKKLCEMLLKCVCGLKINDPFKILL